MDINEVEWISKNRIALGLGWTGFDNGLIEIWQIDEEGTTNSRVIKQFKHNVSLRIRRFYNLPHFAFLLLKGWIMDLKWNETTKYLAASSSDRFIKVLKFITHTMLIG